MNCNYYYATDYLKEDFGGFDLAKKPINFEFDNLDEFSEKKDLSMEFAGCLHDKKDFSQCPSPKKNNCMDFEMTDEEQLKKQVDQVLEVSQNPPSEIEKVDCIATDKSSVALIQK